MDFSVVFCTFNRAANLPACIGHLAKQEATEALEWEVLLVDNNSSDDTAATFERLKREHSVRLRYCFEPKQGLSHACNRGVRDAHGGDMAFHRRALDRVGDFNPERGRKGAGAKPDELFKVEETEYLHRLVSEGGGARIRYLPEAEVEHRILPYQLRRRFFLTIHFNEGLQTGRFASAPEGKTFLGAPLYLYNLTLRAVSRWLTQTLREGPDGSMRRLITLAHFIGQVRGNMVGSAREKNA